MRASLCIAAAFVWRRDNPIEPTRRNTRHTAGVLKVATPLAVFRHRPENHYLPRLARIREFCPSQKLSLDSILKRFNITEIRFQANFSDNTFFSPQIERIG